MKYPLSTLKHHPVSIQIYGNISDNDIQDLVASMDVEGQKEALVLNQRLEIVSGNRRFKAALKLGWTEIEAIQQDFLDDSEEIVEIVTRNLRRKRKQLQLLNEYNQLKEAYSVGQGSRTDLKINTAKFGGKKYQKNSRMYLSHILQISEGTLENLQYVGTYGPEMFDKIDEGEMSVSRAAKIIKERRPTSAKQTNNNCSHRTIKYDFVGIDFQNTKHNEYSDNIVNTFLTNYSTAKKENRGFTIPDILKKVIFESEQVVDKYVEAEDRKYLTPIDSFTRAIKSSHFMPYLVTIDDNDGNRFAKSEIKMAEFFDKLKIHAIDELKTQLLLKIVKRSILFEWYLLNDKECLPENGEPFIICLPQGYNQRDLEGLSSEFLDYFFDFHSKKYQYDLKEIGHGTGSKPIVDFSLLHEKLRWMIREKYLCGNEIAHNSIPANPLLTNLSKVA